MSSVARSALVAALAVALAGCNRYELFVLTDGHGARPNDADVLFVIDNSDSMLEESVALAENFEGFVDGLAARTEGYGTDGLPDAVDLYVDYVQDPAYFVDYQLAITTIDAGATGGALKGDVLTKGTDGLGGAFNRSLMCEAACFPERQAVPTDAGYRCGDPFTGAVTQQYLDCLCGDDGWLGHCGNGKEEGIEAVYDAVCRAVDDPPDTCFDGDGPLTRAEAHTNAGLLRPGATLIPVVVTDEGDGSRRLAAVDAVPQRYVDLFAALGTPMAWAVIGPALTDAFELACPGTATSWGVLRYVYLADTTGGVTIDIHGADCGPVNWATALGQLGNLVGGGVRSYVLPQRPVVSSIVVELGGERVDPAPEVGEDVFGAPIHGDGWSYDPDKIAVVLHGAALPENGERVQIWFQPAR